MLLLSTTLAWILSIRSPWTIRLKPSIQKKFEFESILNVISNPRLWWWARPFSAVICLIKINCNYYNITFFGFITETEDLIWTIFKSIWNRAIGIKRNIPHCHLIFFPRIFDFSCSIKWFWYLSITFWATKSCYPIYIRRFNSINAENMKFVISTSSLGHKLSLNSEMPLK